MKNYVAIDIGASTVEVASTGSGKGYSSHTPNNLVAAGSIVSYDAMAEHLTETMKAGKVSGKDAAVLIPSSRISVRMLTMPAMKHEELLLNLPYEFREFVGNEEREYIYDYAVADTKYSEQGKPVELTLLAAAVRKSVVKDYAEMLKAAGLKLKIAAPEEMGYINLVRNYIKENPEAKEQVFFFVDLGHSGTRIHVLLGDYYTFSRTIDIGGQDVEAVVSSHFNVDTYIAHEYKENNYQSCLELPGAQEIYDRIAVEVFRAVNFFQYSHPDITVNNLYVCGGGKNLSQLMQTISSQNAEIPIQDAKVLYPRELKSTEDYLTPAALGVTLL